MKPKDSNQMEQQMKETKGVKGFCFLLLMEAQ